MLEISFAFKLNAIFLLFCFIPTLSSILTPALIYFIIFSSAPFPISPQWSCRDEFRSPLFILFNSIAIISYIFRLQAQIACCVFCRCCRRTPDMSGACRKLKYALKYINRKSIALLDSDTLEASPTTTTVKKRRRVMMVKTYFTEYELKSLVISNACIRTYVPTYGKAAYCVYVATGKKKGESSKKLMEETKRIRRRCWRKKSMGKAWNGFCLHVNDYCNRLNYTWFSISA